MKILFFANRLIYGGGEKVRNWLALQLVNSGHQVFYATSRNDSSYIRELKEVSLVNKIKVIEYPYHYKMKSPFKYWKKIYSIYKDNNIDILIYFGGSLIEQLIAKRLGIKIILSERCDPMSRPFLSRMLKHFQYRVCDGIVFQTPEASKCYGKRAERISTIIPNPIIDELPAPIFNKLRKEIVTVGRLSKEKNQMMLLQAFNQIHNSIPEYKLVIYGAGPLEEQLLDYIKLNGLNDKIQIVKGKTNIPELINGASLFVLSSNTEGMPNALIEAMSMGILSISTDCPIYGPRFLVRDGENAFLTPIGDSDNLARKMIQALESPNANTIRHEAFKIRETLDANNIFNNWEVYIDLILHNYEK